MAKIMNTIYRKKNYNIYKIGKGNFIVHNTSKKFEKGHTHINNYNAAKTVIYLSMNSIVPKHLSKYLIESIIRISTDTQYIDKLKELLL